MRVLITFYSKRKSHEMALSTFPTDGVRISDGRYDARVYYEASIQDLSELTSIVEQFLLLNCICHSLKIFTPGQIPKLDNKGFEFNGVYYLKPVFAQEKTLVYSIVPYGPLEWCLMIEHRKGNGVPLSAIEKIPYYDVIATTEQMAMAL